MNKGSVALHSLPLGTLPPTPTQKLRLPCSTMLAQGTDHESMESLSATCCALGLPHA